MTPNEKELLKQFHQVSEASAITMSKMMNPSTNSAMNLSVDYVQRLCQSLVAQGHLLTVEGGRWPVFRMIKEKTEDREQMTDDRGQRTDDRGQRTDESKIYFLISIF